MLSRLGSMFTSVKENVSSFAGRGLRSAEKIFGNVKNSFGQAFARQELDDAFLFDNAPITNSRASVRESVRAQIPVECMDETPGTEMFAAESGRREKRSIFSVISLDMPEVKRGQAHGRMPKAVEPGYARGMTAAGMFGVQFWPKEEDLLPSDPLSVFQAFSQFSQLDETPMTPSFQQEVRNRAVAAGLLDFDPLANLNHGLATNGQYQKKPALSTAVRVQPYPAPTAHAGEVAGWQVLADMAQQFGGRALNAVAV